MIIGLVSDTHLNEHSEELMTKIKIAFKGVDLILHAGDLTSEIVIEDLEKIAPVIAVQGNMDRFNGLDLPKTQIIEKEGIKIGLSHGEVYPRGDNQQLYYIAKELGVKILVTGHTHQAKIEEYEDVLLLNPGSPTSPKLADPTVMLLELDNGEVEVKPIKLGESTCSALNLDQFKKWVKIMGSRWQQEKKNDPYYKKAKSEEYRSRASYKLKQLDKKFKIIKQGNTVVDLGASPGGWSQIALEKVGEEGLVVGVDLNRIKPFEEENFYSIRGDFTIEEVQNQIIEKINGKTKVLISDASPSLTGIKNIDQLNSYDLIDSIITIADNILEPKGNLVIKAFQGKEYKAILDKLKKKFRVLKTTKPPSSRKKSAEIYIIGLGFKKQS